MVNSAKKLNQDASYFLTEFSGYLSINGIEIMIQNIINLSIRESIFDLIPVLELTIIDDGTFVETYPLQDMSTIKITLGSSNLKIPIIEMEFELQDFTTKNLDGDTIKLVQIDLTGLMKNKNLFVPSQTRSFKNKSSIEVLKSIATEAGFEPIVKTSTSDNMTWRQVEQNNFKMIYETMKRSFRNEDVVLTGITREKKFIITSLMTECKNKNAKKIIYDPLGAISLSNEKTNDKKDIFYFNNFETSNISGMVNKTIAYGMQFSVYDFDKVTEKTIKSISHPLSKFSFKNKTKIGNIVDERDMYFFNNLNMHRNYHQAILQNEFLTNNFFTNLVLIHINPSEKINIFDKVDVTFPSFDSEGVNQPQSGEYIVGTIVHQVSKGGMYRMSLALFRNGINQSAYQKESEIELGK